MSNLSEPQQQWGEYDPNAPDRRLAVVEAPQVTHVYTDHEKALIRTMIGAKDDEIDPDELDICLRVAGRSGLDIFAKQIYFIPRWDTKLGRNRLTIQTGIDGYRLIAARTGELAGIDDPDYGPEDAEGHPAWARCTVWRFVREHRVSFSATARWKEYAQYGRSNKDKSKPPYLTGKWEDMPYLMLGKCAEALALRKGFPAELSGIYTDDEMGQADNPPHGGRTVVTEQQQPEQQQQHEQEWATSRDEGAYATLAQRARRLGVSERKWREAKAHFQGDTAGIEAWLAKVAAAKRETYVPEEDEVVQQQPSSYADGDGEPAATEPAKPEAAESDPLYDAVMADVKLRRRLDKLGWKTAEQVGEFVADARRRGAATIEDARVVCGQYEQEAERAAENAPSLEELQTGAVRP